MGGLGVDPFSPRILLYEIYEYAEIVFFFFSISTFPCDFLKNGNIYLFLDGT